MHCIKQYNTHIPQWKADIYTAGPQITSFYGTRRCL